METTRSMVAGAAVALGLLAAPADATIRREDFAVRAEDGTRLAVREVRDAGAVAGGPPVILVHGARVPGIASFDLPVPGGSLAADIARAGHRVFVMDVRGYGGSDRPGQDGPGDGAPLVRSEEAARDVGAVVDAVLERTGADAAALVGWATGGHWAGMHASRRPGTVSHLVLYNTLYGGTPGHPSLGPGTGTADPDDPSRFDAGRFGAYRLNTAASLLPSWDRSIPAGLEASWRDPRVVEAYLEAALASDPTSDERDPPSFRAPSGAMADSFDLAAGAKPWDAGDITGRVLVLRSGNDFWSRPEDAAALERDLASAAGVRMLTIPDATHYLHLDRPERGRDAFLRAVLDLLATPPAG
jgi:pimeloyl-ACP methyl ester carboxylesterase